MSFRPSPARAPASLLREEKHLKALFNEAQRLSRLQQLLETQLQPAAREHCHVSSWRAGCLLLIITDGHWATRLRYQQKRLQRQLMAFEEFANLTKILFKVQPPAAPRRAPSRTMTLSNDAADNIRASAEHITHDRLRAALERLASHAPNAVASSLESEAPEPDEAT
jgi:hypothetical protein